KHARATTAPPGTAGAPPEPGPANGKPSRRVRTRQWLAGEAQPCPAPASRQSACVVMPTARMKHQGRASDVRGTQGFRGMEKMDTTRYQWLHREGETPIKGWVRGVPLEDKAHAQLRNIASLPFVGPWVAVMPDVHLGIGATVGSVVPTQGAIIPAAVGVDIGCGMAAVRTTLGARDLPDSLARLRSAIERAIPVGNGPGGNHRR